MTADIQSIEFLKATYPKDRAIQWLTTNRYPEPSKLHSSTTKWKYDIRPTSSFMKGSFYNKPVGDITFVYGKVPFITERKAKKKLKHRKAGKRSTEVLIDVMKDYSKLLKEEFEDKPKGRTLEEATGGSVQSVRVPKNWGLEKARHWVDNKGWTPDYYGKSPFTETDKWYRFRQHAPHKGDDFKIKSLPNKVQLVMEYN